MTDAYSSESQIAKELWVQITRRGRPVREPDLLGMIARKPYTKNDRKKLNGYLVALERTGSLRRTKKLKINYWDAITAHVTFLNMRNVQLKQMENGWLIPLERKEHYKDMLKQQKIVRNLGGKNKRPNEVRDWYQKRKQLLGKDIMRNVPDVRKIKMAVNEYMNYYLDDNNFLKKLKPATANQDIIDFSYALAIKKEVIMSDPDSISINKGYTLKWRTCPGSNYFFCYNTLDGIRVGGYNDGVKPF